MTTCLPKIIIIFRMTDEKKGKRDFQKIFYIRFIHLGHFEYAEIFYGT